MKNSSKRRTSRHLQVAQHKHTGHVLPRRSTSYPALAMILLCVGVFLGGWTRFVTADPFPPPASSGYTVHASVPGPPPTVPATIDSPQDGTIFSSTPISVSGTCPTGSYVSLLRNGFNSGVALCDPTGNYQLDIDLFVGVNQLVAQDYSYTDAPGPASTIVTVTRKAPVNSGGSSSSSGTSGTSSTQVKTPSLPYSPSSQPNLPEPLLLESNFTFLGYYVGDTANWKVNIAGGTAPYAIEADWGDGSHQLYSQASASSLTLEHVYKKTGGYHGSYQVKITATDAAGNQTYLQLIAIISNKPKTVTGGSANTTGSSGSGLTLLSNNNLSHLVKYVWPSYGIVVLMLVSFWLGERREFGYLRSHARKPRH